MKRLFSVFLVMAAAFFVAGCESNPILPEAKAATPVMPTGTPQKSALEMEYEIRKMELELETTREMAMIKFAAESKSEFARGMATGMMAKRAESSPRRSSVVDAVGLAPCISAYGTGAECVAAPWAILATDRWFHFASKVGLRPGFIGDLHDLLQPGDQGACCIWASGGNTTVVRVYLSTPTSQQPTSTSSNFDVAADWGNMPTYDAGEPAIAMTCGPVFEIGQTPSRARGWVPNLYRVYPRPSAANSHIIVDSAQGMEGRMFLSGYGYGWSLDEEWL